MAFPRSIVREPDVPGPLVESAPLGVFGQEGPSEVSSVGKWIVGLSLGLAIAVFVGTLALGTKR